MEKKLMSILNDVKVRELFAKMGRTYAPDTIIFLEEDNNCDEMYIIVTGEVEITKTFKEQEIFGGARLTIGSISETIAVLKAGDFFGEMALWNDAPRMATARARTMVEAIVLSKNDLERLVLLSPALAVQMMKSLCERLRKASQSPRFESVLPSIQQIILSFQNRRAAGTSVSPAKKEKENDSAAKHNSLQNDLEDKIIKESESPAIFRCPSCSYSARFSDIYCGKCGKKLDR